MKPVIVAWLERHGLPRWIAPDYVTMVVLASVIGGWLVLWLAERDRVARGPDAGWRRSERVEIHTRALIVGYAAALLGGYAFESARALPAALAARSIAPLLDTGRAAYGGLLFGLAAPALYLRWRRAPIRAFLDRSTLALGVAYAAVRTGCFLEGCDYGTPTRSPLGVRFPPGSLAADAHARAGWIPAAAQSLPVHPTELYEAALGLAATLLALIPLRRGRRDGTAIRVWLATYAVGRFLIELLRGDAERGAWLGLSTAQWVSALVLLGVVVAHPRAAALSDATYDPASGSMRSGRHSTGTRTRAPISTTSSVPTGSAKN